MSMEWVGNVYGTGMEWVWNRYAMGMEWGWNGHVVGLLLFVMGMEGVILYL